MEWLLWFFVASSVVLAVLLAIMLTGRVIDWYYLPPAPPAPKDRSGRNRWVAAALAFVLGGLGIHKFYLGQSWQGGAYLLFFWTLIPALLSLIDMAILLSMSDDQFEAAYG